jgi:GNAT superfamily N-acetyltransferase
VAADADGVARVHERAWAAAYRGLLPDEALAERSVDARRAQWAAFLAGGEPEGHVTLVAERDGEVVGFAALGPARDVDLDRTTVGELEALNVDPEAWGSGVGRALVAETCRALRRSGFSRAVLWVLTENERARRFYEQLGWEVEGAERLFEGAPEVRYRTAL